MAVCFIIPGKDETLDVSGKTTTNAVVLKLVEGLENSGQHLYCDNYYSSPQLFLALWSLGIGRCGTVRKNRHGVPPAMRSQAKMTKDEVKSVNTEGILSLKWMDKQKGTAIFTLHDDHMVTKRGSFQMVEEIMKPRVISDYNTYMGGVDKAQSAPFSRSCHN